MIRKTSYKICLVLFLCLLGWQLNCPIKQTSQNTANNANQQTTEIAASNEKIKQLFVDSGLGEGDGMLEELMVFPKEKIIAVVQKLKENGLTKNDEQYFNENSNEYLKIKSAYFLWSLGVEKELNEKYIVEIEKKNDFRKFTARSYLMNMIAENRKEYLPIIFETAYEAQGGNFTEISGFFVGELEGAPKIFLLYLSKMPFKIRKDIYKIVTTKGEVYDEKTFQKIKENVKKLKDDKETKNIVAEFLTEVNKKQ